MGSTVNSLQVTASYRPHETPSIFLLQFPLKIRYLISMHYVTIRAEQSLLVPSRDWDCHIFSLHSLPQATSPSATPCSTPTQVCKRIWQI